MSNDAISKYRDACRKFDENVTYENAWEVLRTSYELRHEGLMEYDRSIMQEAAQVAINERNYYPM